MIGSTPPIPQLHVGQSAARIAMLDPVVIAAGMLVFSAAIALIWGWGTSAGPLLFRQGTRRRAANGVMCALVSLALLPTVLPFDHLFIHDITVASASAAHEAVHVEHCHISPGSCSDAPVPSGPGQLLLAEPLVVVPAMLLLFIAVTAPVLLGITVAPRARPPRPA